MLLPVAEGEAAVEEAVDDPEADEETGVVSLFVALVHETLEAIVALLLKVTSAH